MLLLMERILMQKEYVPMK